MKTYVLTLSKVFPATHKRHGEPTYFWERFSSPSFTRPKQHVGFFTRIISKVTAFTVSQYLNLINNRPIGRIKYALA